MFDRYDPRDDERDSRDRGRDLDGGGRGGGDAPDQCDPRDVFTKDLDLPRGRERRPVRERDRMYEINGNEGRMLATVGAFRVVSESDLDDGREGTRKGLHHLEREGLVRTSLLSSDDRAVVLTGRGRDLLEASREKRQDRAWEPRQTFYAGLRKPRELTHDSKVYRAYQRAEERLRGQGGRVRRVVLDYELKRDYQRFLHERNRGKKDCDGRPDREPGDIARWAREHPRGALDVVALRVTTDGLLNQHNVPHRCRAQRHADYRTSAPNLQTPQGMLAAVTTEARAALVGDREDSTANRMTQSDRFGSHDTDRATAARLSPPGLRCRQHARIGATDPAR